MLTLLALLAAQLATQPEVIVYTGPRDPRYAIPEKLREQHRRENETRMLDAARFQSTGIALLQQMQLDPTFGGLVFRHLPEPHALVMFTGDAEARLRRYTSDPRYRAVRVDLPIAVLEQHKSQVSARLRRLGIRCMMVDADEVNNRVTIRTPNTQAVHDAIAHGRFRPPPKYIVLDGACAELR